MSKHTLRLDVVTIFPEYLEPLRHALLGKAIEQGIVSVGVHDLRQWGIGVHRSVDAPPLGGGPGMVMRPDVWGEALDAVADGHEGEGLDSAAPHRNDKARHDEVNSVAPRPYEVGDVREGESAEQPLLIVPTPAGTPFTQQDAQAWSRESHIVFACGRYEGIDQRVFVDAQKRYRVREVSIGDYVLIGGEVVTLVIAEAVTRLIPGVLGNTQSHEDDSFSDGLLEDRATRSPVHGGESMPLRSFFPGTTRRSSATGVMPRCCVHSGCARSCWKLLSLMTTMYLPCTLVTS